MNRLQTIIRRWRRRNRPWPEAEDCEPANRLLVRLMPYLPADENSDRPPV